MSQEKYIVAIEIGSSKITLAAARSDDAGRLFIVAVEQEHNVEFVSHGVIHNVEETAAAITRLMGRLESRTGISPRKVTRAIVGISGQSMRNIPREVSRSLPDDTEITEQIIDSLREEAIDSNIDASLEIIDAVPSNYFVNKSETHSPVGTFGSSIRARYQLIAANPRLRKLLERVVRDKAGIPIADLVVTPLAVADLILSPQEKRLGCMLVDLGAETTTVTIYQHGALHYMAVLPMGGRNITRDITSLNVLEERAEEIKTTSGNAIPSEHPSRLNLDGVKLSDVANLVAARSAEIVANIIEQIKYAGIDDKTSPLSAGIITIGGGFNLNRMTDLLKNQSNLEVRRGTLPSHVTIEDTKAPSYETIEVAGLLQAGADPRRPECMEIPVREELPASDFTYGGEEEEERSTRRTTRAEKKRGSSLLDSLKIRMANFFKEDPNDDPEIE